MEGKIEYDVDASRLALLALLRDPAHAAHLPWNIGGCENLANYVEECEKERLRLLDDDEDRRTQRTSTLSCSTAATEADARIPRRTALFGAFATGPTFHDPFLRAGAREGEPLHFADGLPASVGFMGAKSALGVTKTCLASHLVESDADGPLGSTWFRSVAATASRMTWWGCMLGNAALVRELNKDPTGATLPVAPNGRIPGKFWAHASKLGGYTDRTVDYERCLKETFSAPPAEGGFGGEPAPGAPFSWCPGDPRYSDDNASSRMGVTAGITEVLKESTDAFHTAFENSLWMNFGSRLAASARWWCATRLPPVATKAEGARRTHAIVCAILGLPCKTAAPPAALRHFVPEQRERLYGAKGGAHVVAPPGTGGADEDWLKKHPTRLLIASAHLLRDAETAWDFEVAAGRLTAWRDSSALRAVGGAAEARAGGGWGRGGGEVDEVCGPEARADAAAVAASAAAAAAIAVDHDARMCAEGEGGGDNPPPYHPPPRGVQPPPLFAIVPQARINVGHARFDARTLKARLKLARHDTDFALESVIMAGKLRRAPLGATFTTDGVVLCVGFTTAPQDPKPRAALGMEDGKWAAMRRRARGAGEERAGDAEGAPPPKASKVLRPRKPQQVVTLAYMKDLEEDTIKKFYAAVAQSERGDELRKLMTAEISPAPGAKKQQPKAITLAKKRKVLAALELPQSELTEHLSAKEAAAANAPAPAAKPPARKRKRERKRGGGGGGGGGAGEESNSGSGSGYDSTYSSEGGGEGASRRGLQNCDEENCYGTCGNTSGDTRNCTWEPPSKKGARPPLGQKRARARAPPNAASASSKKPRGQPVAAPPPPPLQQPMPAGATGQKRRAKAAAAATAADAPSKKPRKQPAAVAAAAADPHPPWRPPKPPDPPSATGCNCNPNATKEVGEDSQPPPRGGCEDCTGCAKSSCTARCGCGGMCSRPPPPPPPPPPVDAGAGAPCGCAPGSRWGPACVSCSCASGGRGDLPCNALCACRGACMYGTEELPDAPPPPRLPGRTLRKTVRNVYAPPLPHAPRFNFAGCPCKKADCPENVERPWLRQFYVGLAVDSGELVESRWRILGCDPGVGNLATVVEYVRLGEGNRLGHRERCPPTKAGRERANRRQQQRESRGDANPRGERVATYVLTRGDLEKKSGKVKHLAQSAKWTREVAAQHALLSTACRKTMRVGRLAEYHHVVAATAGACWANRERRRIARAAFGVWCRSNAALDAFWAGVLRGRKCDGTTGMESRTVMGYGDWRGGFGAPTARVRASANLVFRGRGAGRVVEIDEFNTSMTCHCCGDVLQDVVDTKKNFKNGRPAGAVERGLKHCLRQTCSTFLDRDVNVSAVGLPKSPPPPPLLPLLYPGPLTPPPTPNAGRH